MVPQCAASTEARLQNRIATSQMIRGELDDIRVAWCAALDSSEHEAVPVTALNTLYSRESSSLCCFQLFSAYSEPSFSIMRRTTVLELLAISWHSEVVAERLWAAGALRGKDLAGVDGT